MHVYIVRHGLSWENYRIEHDTDPHVSDPVYDQDFTHNNANLCPQGVLQAKLTGLRLQGVPFDAALVSPVDRAMQTAANILQFQKKMIPIEIMPDLAECGHYTYVPMPDDMLKKLWHEVVPIRPEHVPPEGSSPNQTEEEYWERAKRFYRYVRGRFGENDAVLIVSHGGFASQYLLPAFLEIPDDVYRKYVICNDNCSIARITYFPDGRICLVNINSTDHMIGSAYNDPLRIH